MQLEQIDITTKLVKRKNNHLNKSDQCGPFMGLLKQITVL